MPTANHKSLNMYPSPVIAAAASECFAQGRMSVDRGEFIDRALHAHGKAIFGYQLSSIMPNDADTRISRIWRLSTLTKPSAAFDASLP